MRIWSMHPRYLDRQALIACWRETLLAQSVLGKTSGGYANHPQLRRFRAAPDPAAAIGDYLTTLADEAGTCGYKFNRTKIERTSADAAKIPLTSGQLAYEWAHLKTKLETRSPDVLARWRDITQPEPIRSSD